MIVTVHRNEVDRICRTKCESSKLQTMTTLDINFKTTGLKLIADVGMWMDQLISSELFICFKKALTLETGTLFITCSRLERFWTILSSMVRQFFDIYYAYANCETDDVNYLSKIFVVIFFPWKNCKGFMLVEMTKQNATKFEFSRQKIK